MKPLEKRLQKLEAAQGMGDEPLTIERWIVTPGSPDAWLLYRVVAGQPDTHQQFEEGEIVRPAADLNVGLHEN